jgi:hypothetical protein
MIAGVSETRVIESFIASPEYQLAHTTDGSFIDSLYANVLGRSESSLERAGWLQILQGGVTRSQAAERFLTSLERYSRVVDGYYLTFLRRRPDAAGKSGWVNLLVNGQSSVDGVAESFLSSPEYQLDAGR